MELIVENNGALPQDPLYFNPPEQIQPPPSFSFPWYQWIGGYSYVFFKSFFPEMQFWQYLIYLPAILVSLAAIPMYYIGKFLYDRKAGVLAAFFVLFDASNVSRSLGGDPDTDTVVILVPLVVFSAFLFAYDRINKINKIDKRVILYSILTGFFLFVWHNTWAGYFYVIWLMCGLAAGKFAAKLYSTKNLKESASYIKPYAICLFAALLAFFLIDFPIFGFSSISGIISEPFLYQNIKSENTVFPNVYVSVAELQNIGGVKEIIERIIPVRGPAVIFSPFALTLVSIVYLGYSYFTKRRHEEAFFVITMWFIGAFVSTLTAVRFTILFAAPMALGTAVILSKIANMTAEEKIAD
jgi:asparagine N-glycosylation enzyme membrane subunit Stt3